MKNGNIVGYDLDTETLAASKSIGIWKKDIIGNIIEFDQRDETELKIEFIDLFQKSFDRLPTHEDFKETGYESYSNYLALIQTVREIQSEFKEMVVKIGRFKIFIGKSPYISINNLQLDGDFSDNLKKYSDEIVDILETSEVLMGSLTGNIDLLTFYLKFHLETLGKDAEELLESICLSDVSIVQKISGDILEAVSPGYLEEQLVESIVWMAQLEKKDIQELELVM